jgi:hypothetical protein
MKLWVFLSLVGCACAFIKSATYTANGGSTYYLFLTNYTVPYANTDGVFGYGIQFLTYVIMHLLYDSCSYIMTVMASMWKTFILCLSPSPMAIINTSQALQHWKIMSMTIH